MKPGFLDISRQEYNADPCPEPALSQSIAHILIAQNESQAWAYHVKGGGLKRKATSAMDRGNRIEGLMKLGTTEVVVSPYAEYRTKEAREWRDAQVAAGRVPVKPGEQDEEIEAAKGILARLKDEYGITFPGRKQQPVIWQSNGVWCKGLLDHWDEPTIDDLKIAETVHPDAIASKFETYGYDIQWAAYTEAVETIRPDLAGRVRMRFLFAEPKPPYEVVVCEPDGEMRALGKLKWERAKLRWGQCLAERRFPGYANGRILRIAPKPWNVAKMMEDTQDEAA
jgi:hypothetical protein